MNEQIEALPFTPTGISVIAALLFVIGYLFRLNAVDRRDARGYISELSTAAATRLKHATDEAAERLSREQQDRKTEREWLTGFYENRLQKITERCEEQLARCDQQTAALRSELQDVKAQLRGGRASYE